MDVCWGLHMEGKKKLNVRPDSSMRRSDSLTKRPRKSQKEDQGNQGTSKQLRGKGPSSFTLPRLLAFLLAFQWAPCQSTTPPYVTVCATKKTKSTSTGHFLICSIIPSLTPIKCAMRCTCLRIVSNVNNVFQMFVPNL